MLGDGEDEGDGTELEQRQSRRGLEVEEPRGPVVDLRLERRPTRAAEDEDRRRTT